MNEVASSGPRQRSCVAEESRLHGHSPGDDSARDPPWSSGDRHHGPRCERNRSVRSPRWPRVRLHAVVHEYHREVLLSVTDKDFADEFSRCLGVILGRAKPYSVRWREKRRRWVVQGASVLFHQFLGSSWSNVKKWLEHCERCGFAFLRAFYDGEGSISGRTLTVSNTNRELLQYIRERLRRAGIVTTSLRLCTKAGTLLKDPTTGRIYVRKKDCFQFSVRAQSLSKFSQLIGFTIARKQARLYDALSGARGKSCKTSNHSP